MLSFFTKRASPISSSAQMEPSTSRPGLKPLHLVDKLLAAKVIDPPQVKKPSAIFRMLDQKKIPRKVQSVTAAPRVSSGGRLSLSSQAVTSKRAPFVVPLHFSGPKVPRVSVAPASRVTPRPTVHKTTTRRPARVPKPDDNTKSVTPSRIPKLRKGSFVAPTKVAVKSAAKKTVSRSRIPLFIRHSSADTFTSARAARPSRMPLSMRSRIPVLVGRPSADVFTPALTPCPAWTTWTTPSRIPRLKYDTSPSSSSSESRSVASFNLQTPCPSPTLVVNVRQMAPKVFAPKTTEVSIAQMAIACTGMVEVGNSQEKKEVITVAPSAMQVSNSGPGSSVQISLDIPQHSSKKITGDVKTDSDSDTNNALPSSSGNAESVCSIASAGPRSTKTQETDTNSTGMMGALIGELKTRLMWTKKSAVATSYSPSPTKGTCVIIEKSECRRSDKENIPISSELHQALARRRSAMSESSRKFDVTLGPKEDRRPLAPVPSFLNTTINSHRVPVSTENAPRHDPVPTEDISDKTLAISGPQSPSSNDNLNPPGADFMVTELVTTAFGTRRVRRLVIPPIAEGSLPSRDPRIIMELNCLRAQQKVGGVPKTD